MTLAPAQIAELLAPYLVPSALESDTEPPQTTRACYVLPAVALAKLSALLELLVYWNARTNLTSVRDPAMMVRRHFGESLFLASHLSPLLSAGSAFLDFGSGAGFPGLPVQLAFPEVAVVLAESQGKKAAFLNEAVRSFCLGTEVWAKRVESMAPSRQFAIVALRAVDRMQEALTEAERRLQPGGCLAFFTGEPAEALTLHNTYTAGIRVPVPESAGRWLVVHRGKLPDEQAG